MNWTSNFYQIDQTQCHFVDSLEEMNAIVKLIEEHHATVFVDTEFLRETTYWPILCLLQIRVGDDIFCIDTLQDDCQQALLDLCELDVTWVLHAAKQDLEIFYQLLGYVPERIFDTQIAAELCGIGEQISYGALVEHFVGVELDKSQTRTRWNKRPLTQAQLVYAAEDVAYLPFIHQQLHDKLSVLDRNHWLAEEQMKMHQEIIAQGDAHKAYKRMRRGGNFKVAVQYAVKYLAIWREQLAMEYDNPRTHILTDDDIYTIAFQVMQKQQSIENIHRSDFKNSRLVMHYQSQIETVLAECHAFLNTQSEQSAPHAIWPSPLMLSKLQKEEIKTYQQQLQNYSDKNHLIASRLARKKDLVDYLYHDQSGRLSKGWRKQLIHHEELFNKSS